MRFNKSVLLVPQLLILGFITLLSCCFWRSAPVIAAASDGDGGDDEVDIVTIKITVYQKIERMNKMIVRTVCRSRTAGRPAVTQLLASRLWVSDIARST